MKRLSWVALAGLLALIGAVARAENKHERGGSGEWKARWAERMGLSEEEAGKLEVAHKEARKGMKPLHRELRDAMTKLRDQVEDKAGDDALKAALERVEKAQRALRAEHERMQAKLSELLPPAKRAKLLLARMERWPGMGMMGHGMRDGFRGLGGRRHGQGMHQERHQSEHEDKMKDSLNKDDEAEEGEESAGEE